VLHMHEVASDAGLASLAPAVEKAVSDGAAIITRNIQDPERKYTIFRRLANIAVGSSKLPYGLATQSEEAVLSRHRILAAIGMAEAAMGKKYPTVDAALSALDAVLAVFGDEAKIAYDNCDNAL